MAENGIDVRQAVAENLRAIREQRRISLEAAAQLTGVSKSMLGQIERAEVNPTISVLWRIAGGMKVSFSTLISPPLDAQAALSPCGTPMVEDEGRYRNYPVFAFDASLGCEQYRIEIEEGGSLDAQPHMAGTRETIVVFVGRIHVTVGEAGYALGVGDGLRFRADVPHRYTNAGNCIAQLSMMIHYDQ